MKKKNKKERNSIKDEFWLSAIFVVKWLALGLGAITIAYYSISIAYDKIYYAPLIKEIDIKLTELVSNKNDKEAILKLTRNAIIKNKKTIANINNSDLPEINLELNETDKQIESLGESLLDKANFWSKKSKEHNDLYEKKSNLINSKNSLVNKVESLEEDNEKMTEEISKITDRLADLNMKIASAETEKEKVGTGGPGMWSWFATFALGINL